MTETIIVNDFESLLSDYASIEYIFFNGTKAEKEYFKRVLPNLKNISREIQYELLPSSSPANASVSKEIKLKKWSKIKSILNSQAC